MGKFIDLTGRVFGRLTVLRRSGYKTGLIAWDCICACGKGSHTRGGDLTSGKIRSCGCLNMERRSTKFGATLDPHYQCWWAMVARCFDPNNNGYSRYGAVGISVYAPWVTDFQAFKTYMGPRPTPDHSIDRIEGSKGYFPGNVRWASSLEQTLNRRVTVMVDYKGVRQSLAVLARAHGLAPKVVNSRVSRGGWSVEKALTTPVIPPPAPCRSDLKLHPGACLD